jgi:hypothetical protein
VFGDHAQFVHRKAVVRGARTHGSRGFVSHEFYVVAHVRFEINRAAGDLENLAGTVLDDCKVAV